MLWQEALHDRKASLRFCIHARQPAVREGRSFRVMTGLVVAGRHRDDAFLSRVPVGEKAGMVGAAAAGIRTGSVMG